METSTSRVPFVHGALDACGQLRVRDSALVRGASGAVHGAAVVARGAADVFGEMARGLATPSGLAGAAIETGWLAAHLVSYPFGVMAERAEHADRGYRIEHLRPHQRGLLVSDIEAAGTPILMIHGLIDNRSIFTLLRRGLRSRGFDRLTTLNYSPIVSDIRVAAAHLGEEVERIVAETGYERIHIIGHSLGGLIARYYVTRLGGDERVHTLVTLGTPHGGTYAAYAWPTRLVAQMRPDSGLIEELRRPVPDCRTRFIAYWSDLDQLIFPQHNAAIDHPDLRARNIALHGVGHVSLPILGSVVHGISAALADLEPDGSTRRPGVAPITPRGRGRGASLPAGRSGRGAAVTGRAT
jgi:pimeloyl-ACP methyl ester carboxylesterase